MRVGNKILTAVVVTAVAAASVAVGVPEIRSTILFKLAPEYARNVHLVRLRASDGEVYLVGTIHAAHLDSVHYNLFHLDALLRNLRPDQLLLESRPEELEQGNVCDGPVEMGFANLSARSVGISAGGMDFFRRDASPGGSDEIRDNEMFARTKRALHRRSTVLILTGYSHVPEFIRRLEKDGYQLDPLTAARKEELFSVRPSPRLFPRGMAACIKHRIVHDEEELAHETSTAWRKRIAEAVTLRKRFLAIVEGIGEAN
ncbi:MAG: hypothetical protein NVS3B20_20820 [Polyangiales bacterium]